MKIDILPAKLEVTRDEDNVVKSAVLKIGGTFARPFKYIAWNVDLDDLAHLEPEEIKQGEWTKFTLEGGFLSSHKCSNCGFHGNQLWHFCPNCGADMRGDE